MIELNRPARRPPQLRQSLQGLLLVLLLAANARAAQIPDFTFVHATDVHAPRPQSQATIAAIRDLGEMPLVQYGVTAKAPSFAVMTGDLTEFGEPYAWLEYLSYWKDVGVPAYHALGNHDSTWNCLRNELRKLYGESFYSFDQFGCHFAVLDSTTPQDPRPGFSVEELEWLKRDLAGVAPETPIFVFFHHPPGGSEYASLYDRDRFLDILRPHNVAFILAGHSHAVGLHRVDGSVDCVMGGSTFGGNAGFNLVSVLDGILRVAYVKAETKMITPVLEKPIPPGASYPMITITSPSERQTVTGSGLSISAAIGAEAGPIAEAWADLDDIRKIALTQQDGGEFTAQVALNDLTAGAHYLRLNFKTGEGKSYHKTTAFYCEQPEARAKAAWRAFLGGSSKCTPTVADGVVYVGAGDGKLYAFDQKTGALKWTFQAGGEIVSQPLVTQETVIFGAGDGRIHGIGTDGSPKWTTLVRSPVYSSPILADGLGVVGGNSGCLYAFDPATGDDRWRNCSAGYAVESKPFAADGTVYFGAWDKFLYAVNAADGSLKWKAASRGAATNSAARYYSPADCGPVAADGNVYVADRAYKLTCFDAPSGNIKFWLDKVAGVGLSEDGRSLYLRKTDGKLVKTDLAGKTIWSAETGVNAVPTAPVENDGVVYAASGTGLVSAVSAPDGRVLWQYQVSPKLFVLSSVTAHGGLAFVSGMDGTLTAIKAAK